MNSVKWLVLLLFIFLLFHSYNSVDTITTEKPVRDGETIESKGRIFILGFFSPGSSTSRYVGIWDAQVSKPTFVWVANRQNPIKDRSGSIEINSRGNIVIYRNNGTVPVWSSNISDRGTQVSVAQLQDSGNLLLFGNVTGKILWQSFDHPTNCMLPFMKLGLTRKSGLNRFLTSWKSPDDPGFGNFSFRINPNGFPQLLLYNGVNPWWRCGSWTGKKWSGVPETRTDFYNVKFVNNRDEISVMYTMTDNSILAIMMVNGAELQQINKFDNHWFNGFWSAPKEQCDYYAHCGPNSYCDSIDSDNFNCTCLPSFEPKSPGEWFLRDWSGGCVRKRRALGPLCHNEDGFVKLLRVKVPDTSKSQVDMDIGLRECKEKCLGNCTCVAYASAYYEDGDGGVGCLTWHGDLLDMRTYQYGGQDFFVRVAATEPGMRLVFKEPVEFLSRKKFCVNNGLMFF